MIGGVCNFLYYTTRQSLEKLMISNGKKYRLAKSGFPSSSKKSIIASGCIPRSDTCRLLNLKSCFMKTQNLCPTALTGTV
jgi:hypothetical protein